MVRYVHIDSTLILTIVPTGYVGVKTRFGKAQDGVVQEGLNYRIPFKKGGKT